MKLKKSHICFLMIAAFTIWIFIFKDFFLKHIGLFPDGRSYYYWTKFYFDNITQGVYPLWYPYENWGYPVGFKIRFLSEFNPFLLLGFIPYQLGLNFTFSFFLYLVSYYFSGMIAFYLIGRFLFKKRFYAFVGFLLLLFSSSGIAMFFNSCEVLLLVPSIWFFWFLLKFSKSPQSRYLLGLTFSLMIILTTYIPFYFLTIFLLFSIFYLVIYFKDVSKILRRTTNFFSRRKFLTFLCIVGVFLSITPGYITYQEMGSGEMTYPHRQGDTSSLNIAKTSLGEINPGSVVGPLTFKRLFSGLQYLDNYLSYFFLSIFAYLILILSIFRLLNKKLLLLFLVSGFSFLISIADVTPLHGFLYDHVFFMKLMRNIFYMLYLAIPFVVLFIVGQFKGILEHKFKNKYFVLGIITFGHVLFFVFLKSMSQIVITSYITLLLSFLISILIILNILSKKGFVFLTLISIVILVQPIEVFLKYTQNFKEENVVVYKEESEQAQFFYKRPRLGEVSYDRGVFPDSDGFLINEKFAGSKWAYQLQMNVNHTEIAEYVQHRFAVYDQVKALSNQQDSNWELIEKSLSTLSNVAFVHSPFQINIKQPNSSAKAYFLSSDNDFFKVLDYDVNSVKFKTNFDRQKFVVYNESYHKDWRAIVNGKIKKLERVNGAFKGLWLPAGENVVSLRYKSIWLNYYYFLLKFIFLLFFICLIKNFIKTRVSHE